MNWKREDLCLHLAPRWRKMGRRRFSRSKYFNPILLSPLWLGSHISSKNNPRAHKRKQLAFIRGFRLSHNLCESSKRILCGGNGWYSVLSLECTLLLEIIFVRYCLHSNDESQTKMWNPHICHKITSKNKRADYRESKSTKKIFSLIKLVKAK